MEGSLATKPLHPAVATQVANSTKDLIAVKPAEGGSPAPSTAKHSSLDKPAHPKMALPVVTNPRTPTSTTTGSGSQNGAMPANPSPYPTTGTESAKKDLTSTPQAPATNLILNKDKENLTSGTGAPEDHQETALADEIKDLWSSQKRKSASLRRSCVDLETLRNSLAERLHTYKDLLVRTGRNGKWTEFLRQENIPRATADRYVKKWKLSKSPKPEKRLTEAFPAPSKEEIARMVKKLAPKLERVLTTPDSVALFMTDLAAALQPSTSVA
jgi:hypothetical protein